MKKVLVTGATGMLGSDIVQIFNEDNSYEVYGAGRSLSDLIPNSRQFVVDFTKPNEVKKITVNPDLIIHTAAITDILSCQNNPDLAKKIHVDSTYELAKLKSAAAFYYVSTDSVFDGTKDNYNENDETNPLNVYAATKLSGERAAIDAGLSQVVILRTNIYGVHVPVRNSLVEWAFKEWQKGNSVSGFTDVCFNAVHTWQLAALLKFLFDNRIFHPILNIGSSEIISKFEFLKRLSVSLRFASSLVMPSLSSNVKTTIPRPANTSLDTTLLSSFYKLPTFNEGLTQVSQKILNHC